jgi:ribose transport system substrate-binding protein
VHFAIGSSLTALLASYILKKPTELDALGNSMPLTLSRFSMQPDGRRRAARYAAWAALFGAIICGCNQSTEAPVSGSKQASGSAAIPAKGNTAAASPDTSKLKRIIILENDNSPFWDAARAGLQDAEKELKLKQAGLRATLEVNDGTPAGQLEKLQQFNSQSDIVGVGVSALDAHNVAVVDELRKLQKKGVQVVTIDSDVSRDKFRDCRFAFIGTENRVGGHELGVCARGLRPQGGGYVTFVGRTDAQNAVERIEGFKEGAGPKFQSLDTMADDTNLARARENVRNAIQNHKDKLNFLVGIWSYNAPAIADVVKEFGRLKDFSVVVFDADPIAIQQIADGYIDAMVVQNPYQMGYQGVRLLKALNEKDQKTIDDMLPRHGKPDGDVYDTGLKIVVPNGQSPLTRGLFNAKTEFLTLDTFKQWLARYSLQGS